MDRLPTLIAWSSLVIVGVTPGAVTSAAQSADDTAPKVTVDHVWSRAAPAGRSAAVFLTITAAGGSDRLTHVAAAIAGGAEIHQSEEQNGVMRMHAVDVVAVAPGAPLKFAPGGYHIMLTNLHHALAVGDTFPITLTFEHAGAITVTATIAKAGAAAAPHDDMPGMDMSDHKMP
jgi:copper(I)-binding protein